MLPAMAALASPQQLQKFRLGWCPQCIGWCNCKRCLSMQVPHPSLATHGGKQHTAFAQHLLRWTAPELRRLHEAKVKEVGGSFPRTHTD